MPSIPDRPTVPEDLSGLTAEQLADLEAQALARFDALREGDVTPEALTELNAIAEDVDRLRAEQTGRQEALAEQEQQLAQLAERVHGRREEEPEQPEGDQGQPGQPQTDGGGEDGQEPEGGTPSGGREGDGDREREPSELVTAAAQAVASQLAPVLTALAQQRGIQVREPAPLAAARAHQPAQPEVPARRLAITAGADIPKVPRGGELEDLTSLAYAVHQRAKSMPVTATELRPGQRWLEYDQVPGAIVASVDTTPEYQHVIDGDRTQPQEIEELWHELVTRDSSEALLAGGGWCAPSETRYDFFNVSCTDGLVDLPTIGIQRGGIQYPVSPSFYDLFTGTFSATGSPWLWTETDDIATVTGAPNKPCVRVPCPSFAQARLECYGLCVTAGNLTNWAYPEATRNFIQYVLQAHERAMNARFMQQILALSSPAVTGALGGSAISVDLPAIVEWGGIDYRARYNMCDGDVLEAIFPYWVRAPIRTDIAARTGREALDVSNAEIDRLFTSRGVRPQFVKDWQMRGVSQPGAAAGTVRYPTQVTFLVYAAGTFVKGNGLTLDLGVTRDSVLNSENDYTAAWMEECHLIARLGHEARAYTTNLCAAGQTGAANLTNCRT